MRSRYLPALLGVLCAFSSTSSSAAVSSSASLGNITFTLIDLDKNDGITPSFQFLSSGGSSYYGYPTQISGSVQNNAGPYSSANFTVSDLTAFSNISHTETIPGANVSVSTGKYFLKASGAAQSASTSYSGSASVQANSSNYYYGYSSAGLQLSAHTALIITAEGATQANGTNSCTSGSYYYYNTCEQSSASITMQLTGPAIAGGSGSQTSSASMISSVAGNYGYGQWVYNPVLGYSQYVYNSPDGSVLSQSSFQQLAVSFVNNSNDFEVASLSASISISGSAVTATVPEPSTLALMALGLASVGFMSRRRLG